MIVINLFAGPGAGKSTTAAGLFNMMKVMGHEVELVTEVAKDLTWEKNLTALENQLFILASQEWKLSRLEGKVDFVITDSPLLLGLLYTTPRFETPWFKNAVVGAWGMYDNLSFYVNRVKPYRTNGRNQTAEEAVILDQRTRSLLGELDVDYTDIRGSMKAPAEIYRYIRSKMNAPNHPPIGDETFIGTDLTP